MPFQETCPVNEKARFCVAYEQGDQTMTELCLEHGISRRTGYETLRRWQAGGPAALVARSHAPLTCPHRTDPALEAAVVAMRQRHRTWGPKKIRIELIKAQPGVTWPAPTTIGEMLDRYGLIEPRRRRRRAAPWTQPFATCDIPHDLWSMDFKGSIYTGDGAALDPFTLQDQASRYLLRVAVLARKDTGHVKALLAQAFHEFGLPLAIRTDNGPPFGSTGFCGLSRLAVWLIQCGVMPDPIDPGAPQQNGRLERMHRDLKAETAAPPAATAREQIERLDAFRTTWNDVRPHEALDQRVPAAFFHPSPRVWDGRACSPEYDGDGRVRRVRSNGEIRWNGGLVYLSSSLAGEPVCIERTGEQLWSLRYGPLPLGQIGPEGKIEARRAAGAPGRRRGDAFRTGRSPEMDQSVTHQPG
jgi:putative transposase